MSMEYFVLSEGKQLVKPFTMLNLKSEKFNDKRYKPNLSKEMFDELEEMIVGYFENKDDVEIPDILNSPSFMVTTIIKKLMELYDENIRFKAFQVFSLDQNIDTCPLYWIPDIPRVSCLHPDAKKYGNGLIKELVLSGEDIEGLDIFKVDNIIENRIIISLAAAESLLRRELTGIGLEKVNIRYTA